MPSPSFITLPYKLERDLPPFETYDTSKSDKYPESLVRYFLNAFTKENDRVFDPFAGLGTTLFVAEEMSRKAYGIEADPDRQEWAAGQLDNWTGLVCDDAANMPCHDLPKMDFAITSPPFMLKHHRFNPLYGGDPQYAGYNHYVDRMGYIFKQLTTLLKRNAYLVVQLDNITGQDFTPLVWDIGQAIANVMRLDQEIIVQWENGPKDYPHTHCLLFKNTQQ